MQKKRPIAIFKKTDTDIAVGRKTAALEWQKRQHELGLPGSLEALEDAVDYCKGNKQGMSAFLNDHRDMHEETLERFANTCGVRLPYLLGIDDVMTDELMQRYGGANRIKGISLQIELLKILGYKIDSILEVYIREWKDADGIHIPFTQEEWSDVKPTLTEEALEFPVTALDGTTIPLREWDGNFENVSTRNFSLRARRTINGSATDGYTLERACSPRWKGLTYTLKYTVSKDGYYRDMYMDELASIFANVNGYLNVAVSADMQRIYN